MKKKRTTRTINLTIERSEFFVVSTPREPTLAWCEECGGHVPFVTPAEAAAASGASLRVIFRQIEAAHIHFVETPDGRLLVCLDSLAPRS